MVREGGQVYVKIMIFISRLFFISNLCLTTALKLSKSDL